MRRYSNHGKRHSPIYHVWCGIIRRCLNPNSSAYPDYGGRGITVCEKWRDFLGFYEDMGDQPPSMTIDRIDNDLGYSPENCRWASRAEQNRNKRSVRKLTIGDETLPILVWAERYGIKQRTVLARIRSGWDAEAAVKTPLIADRKGKPRGHRWCEHFDAARDAAGEETNPAARAA